MPLGLLAAVAVAEERVLLTEDFESGRGPWDESVGARLAGPAVLSGVDWEGAGRSGRGLHLSADAATTRWMSVSRQVAVEPGSWIRVSAWVRTENVGVEGLQFDNAYVGVWWRGAGHAVAEMARGTSDWSLVSRILQVPAGVDSVAVTVFLSESGAVWVDDLVVEQIAPLAWESASTEHFVFHWLPEAPIDEDDRAAVEARLAFTEARLGIAVQGPPTEFFRYPTRELEAEITGMSANAQFDGHAIHSIFPRDDHEMVHLLAAQISPGFSSLMTEGLAVCVSEQWQGIPVDDWVRRERAAADLPSLGTLADQWGRVDDLVSYGLAGSFVQYLVKSKGMPLFLQAYRDQRRGARAALQAAYGESLEALEADWLAAIGVERAPDTRGIPIGFPELAGSRLVRDVALADPCDAPGDPVDVLAGTAVRVPGPWTLADGAGSTRSGTGLLALDLAPGRYTVCVGDRGAALEVRPAPGIWISVADLGPGDLAWRTVTRDANRSDRPLASRSFMASDFVRYEQAFDDDGAALPLTSTHDEARRLYHYEVVRPRPIAPGAPYVEDDRGHWSDVWSKPAGDGTWTYDLTTQPNVGWEVLDIAIFRLPPGAALVDAGPGVVSRTVDGHLEVARVAWVAAFGTVRTRFRYRLPGG